MATPTPKHPAIADLLNKMGNRSEAIYSDRCVDEPYGCAGPATEFRDDLSRREYRISGLCQKCQDRVFGKSEE
jgi:hypothetical protein